MTMQQLLVPIGMKPNEGARHALGGVSRPTVYGLINRGELVHVKVGRRGFVTADSLEAFVARRVRASRGVA